MSYDWGLWLRILALKVMLLLMMTVALMIPTGVDLWTSFAANVVLMFTWTMAPNAPPTSSLKATSKDGSDV